MVALGITVVGLAIWLSVGYVLWIPVVNVSPALSLVLRAIGLILFLTGIGLALWARQTLGKDWAVSSGLGVRLQLDHQLIQNGPFALVRHPMYGW